MAGLDVISKNYSDVNGEWGRVIDTAVRERPVFIQRTDDSVVMLSLSTLSEMFRRLKFNVSLIHEDDGSVTGVVEELDLIENAGTENDCVAALMAAMRDYAGDFYGDFSFWASAPNRRSHIPYVIKILSSSDAQLMEDVICRDGGI